MVSITSKSELKSIKLNNLIGIDMDGKYYNNVADTNSNITYDIITFTSSYLWLDITTTNMINKLQYINKGYVFPFKDVTPLVINVTNNLKIIEPATESDIYIDCKPTDITGTSVNIYTSKNLDQLRMFKINDLRIWAFRFITVFVILLIIYAVIKIFQINDKPNGQNKPDITSSTTAAT
jgi:hypothetical protein